MKDFTDIEKSRWQVDCQKIWLTHRPDGSPVEVFGPGSITQDSDGVIAFKMHADGSMVRRFKSIPHNLPAGTLVSDDCYADVHAVDSYGREWTARRVDINQYSSGCTTPPTLVVSGTLYELTCTGAAYPLRRGAAARVWIRTNGELVFTDASEVQTRIAGMPRSSHEARDVAKFSSEGFTFEAVSLRKHELIVNIKSTDYFNDEVVVRLIQSLQFVTGKPVQWYLLQVKDEDNEEVRIRSRIPMTKRTRLSPPMRPELRFANEYWRLFDYYFRFLGHDHSRKCPAYIADVREASANSIDVMLRELAIAIEGLALDLFPDLGRPSDRDLNDIERLREYLELWPGAEDPEEVNRMRERFSGLIAMLKSRGAPSVLSSLVDRGAIDERLRKLWKRVRPKSAHGSIPHTRDWQEHIDDVSGLTVLFYELIFHVIGYSGIFHDYSQRGFPLRKYPEDISISAEPSEATSGE